MSMMGLLYVNLDLIPLSQLACRDPIRAFVQPRKRLHSLSIGTSRAALLLCTDPTRELLIWSDWFHSKWFNVTSTSLFLAVSSPGSSIVMYSEITFSNTSSGVNGLKRRQRITKWRLHSSRVLFNCDYEWPDLGSEWTKFLPDLSICGNETKRTCAEGLRLSMLDAVLQLLRAFAHKA